MIDFGGFRKSDQRGKSADPRDIFKRRPSGEGAANDLWRGQSEALGTWFEGKKEDTLVLLNTGAGKTIIGLLIAQSFVNQGTNNVVYACSTIDLVKQTAKEAKKLGLTVSIRAGGKFDNELFNQGRSFCITTYAAILNSKTIFRGNLKPGAIIFDDAHIANRAIRESFTLQIKKDEKTVLFKDLVEHIRPSFDRAGLKLEFESMLRNDNSLSVFLVPPCDFYDSARAISETIDKQITETDSSLVFPWGYLRDRVKMCACFISNDVIEITPPFLPTLSLPAFARDVKRVYLSATITTRADFTRVFGRAPDQIIAPDVDAGDGERLFLFASKFEGGVVALRWFSTYQNSQKL